MGHSKDWCSMMERVQENWIEEKGRPMGGGYIPWGTFLEKGIEYFDVDLKQSKELRGLFDCKYKECFANAQMIAINESYPDLMYCEGFGCNIVPAHHAWLLDIQTAKVVDPTWVLEKSDDADYFGFPIPDEFLWLKLRDWSRYEADPTFFWDYIEKIKEEETKTNVKRNN